MQVVTLALGAALYFDHELAADPQPLVTLWTRIAKQPGLRSWTLPATSSSKPVDFNPARLAARIASGKTIVVGVETRNRDVTITVGTTPSAQLDRRPPAPRWKYDLAVGLGADRVAALGQDNIVEALCTFASATAASAGIVVWSASIDFARALASLSSGPDLQPAHVTALIDAQVSRGRWGDVIRGPAWGTFLSAAHVAALGGRALPVARTMPLSSGGAFLQATLEPFDVEAPPPVLAELREVLAPVC
ncbi:MAG: hypothetical protein KF773_32425 [Deltaproteobacteria bacterium]|nr:hypothetical protein [Deltaproteobacteria bacterium]